MADLTYQQALNALAVMPGVTQEMVDAIERVEAERARLATQLAGAEESRDWYRKQWHDHLAANVPWVTP